MFRNRSHFLIRRAFVIGCVLGLGACSPPPAPKAPLNAEPLTAGMQWAWQVESPGRYWLAYYGPNGRIHLQTPTGGPEKILNPVPDGGSSGLALAAQNERAYLLWRDKSRTKTLQFFQGGAADAETAPPIALDRETEALTRFRIAAVGDSVYALWYGERGGEYALYFKHSTDGGRTFGETQRVLPGIYPAWVADAKGVAVFTWTTVKGKHHFLTRRYDAATRQFGPEVDIGEGTEIPPSLEAFRSGSRLFLTSIAQHGEYHNELKLQAAYSDDQGQTWRSVILDAMPGVDYSRVKFCADGDDHLYVAYSAKPRWAKPQEKDNVYLRASSDNGANWSPPVTVRRFDDPDTHATNPVLACRNGGEVVVAWEDWRTLRPQIYLNRSSDHGATWLAADVPVGDPGSFFTPDGGSSLQADGDHYSLVAERYRDDAFHERDLVMYTVDPRALKAGPPAVEATDRAALEKRVNAYWTAFEKEDFHATYGMHDPFFRSLRKYEEYASKLGKIKFHGHTVKAIRVNGNRAEVDLGIEYSVPKLKVGTREYEQPKTEIALTERWIYIDGDWFRVYKEEATDTSYVRY